MTDKEMIEFAAKAVGLKYHENGDGLPGYVAASNGDWRYGWCFWNPIVDDAQAFRLAVKLNLSYSINGEYVVVHGYAFPNLVIHKFEGDVLDAVRMAIVMAAAEIGKGM